MNRGPLRRTPATVRHPEACTGRIDASRGRAALSISGASYAEDGDGWVIQRVATHRDHTGQAITRVGYWYGPTRGLGTSAGDLAEAAMWPTQPAAHRALRVRFGSVTQAQDHGYLAIPVSAARKAVADRVLAPRP